MTDHIYYKRKELVRFIKGRPHPMRTSECPINESEIDECINRYGICAKTPTRKGFASYNGWVTPNGVFVPCSYEGHLFLIHTLGYKDAFGKVDDSEFCIDVHVEQSGWLKLSNEIIHVLWRPTDAQKRTIKRIEILNGRVEYTENPHGWVTLSLPPRGYNSFMFEDKDKKNEFRAWFTELGV